ncbi:MAG: hypothetical protein KDI48_17735 [Xanthomonadales bacterium]|nr:hypothetical protein [Xanthomonadales bacterium]
MTIRILCAAVFATLLSGQVLAVADQSPAPSDSGAVDRFVQNKADVGVFLDELVHTMSRVKAGELGSMTAAELSALESAHQRIKTLLQGHQLTSELPPEDRISVYNAQQLMQAIIRRQPYEQQICAAYTQVGTRISKYECESWENREQRKRNGQETTRRLHENGLICPDSLCQGG